MSAINFLGDEEVYGEIIKGWNLVRLVKPTNYKAPKGFSSYSQHYSTLHNNVHMFWGDWGLTRLNDPDFIFRFDPLPKTSRSKKYSERLRHYSECLTSNVEIGYSLMHSCLEAGYNPQKLRLAEWLMDRMYQHLKKSDWKPTHTYPMR